MDKRINNGNKGHSTKAKGIDKRKNEYRLALAEASTKEDVIQVIQTVKQKAIKKQDIQAAKLFLEYYLGKPDANIDIKSNGETLSFNELVNFGSNSK